MPKINLLISICIFSILLGITSTIKNQTRSIEKSINKLDKKIAIIEKDLYETELDYFYLSSPNNLSAIWCMWLRLSGSAPIPPRIPKIN